MKNFTLLIFLFFFVSLASQAQLRSVKKAEKYYDKYAFDKAIKGFAHLDSLSIDDLRKLAISYKNSERHAEAASTYAKLLKHADALAEDFYSFSLMLKAQGKYPQADSCMQAMSQHFPQDLRVKSFLNTKSSFTHLSSSNPVYQIANLKMNTKYDDFGPSYYNKQIVYTSNKRVLRFLSRIYAWTNRPFFDIVLADVDSFELQKPTRFSKKMNRKWHEGPSSFARSGKLMAFTRNDYDGKSADDVVKLQIFTAEFGKGEWTEPEPFFLNNPEYSVGHPAFNRRGNVLFFASDMPGGFGGSDLYLVKKIGKNKWSKPVNLGDKINTEGNEMFPFYEDSYGHLFFASNGLNGLGGLDVYVATKTPIGFDMVENLGAPVNTQWDDFAYIIDKKNKNGYFSSNRPSGKGGDDLYQFAFSGKYKEYVEPKDSISSYTYRMAVLNEETSQPIPKAQVMLDVVPTETASNGTVSAQFDANTRFEATISATGYVDKKHSVDIKNSQSSAIVNDTVYLTIDKNRRIELRNIYYDFNKSDILPESAAELDKLVDFLKQNPQLKIELSSHTDSRGYDKENLQLSQRRAKAAFNYIVSSGIEPERLKAVGYGETRLLNHCRNGAKCSEPEHRQNRRTEVFIQDYGKTEEVPQIKGKE